MKAFFCNFALFLGLFVSEGSIGDAVNKQQAPGTVPIPASQAASGLPSSGSEVHAQEKLGSSADSIENKADEDEADPVRAFSTSYKRCQNA